MTPLPGFVLSDPGEIREAVIRSVVDAAVQSERPLLLFRERLLRDSRPKRLNRGVPLRLGLVRSLLQPKRQEQF